MTGMLQSTDNPRYPLVCCLRFQLSARNLLPADISLGYARFSYILTTKKYIKMSQIVKNTVPYYSRDFVGM